MSTDTKVIAIIDGLFHYVDHKQRELGPGFALEPHLVNHESRVLTDLDAIKNIRRRAYACQYKREA